MPKVGSKHFPYTEKGKTAAKKARKSVSQRKAGAKKR